MSFLHRPRWRPISVLTGFLGSGKTTMVNGLLQQAKMGNTALIINEFGEEGIDHLLVEETEEKLVLLSNGCVCCSVRGDLVEAIHSLFRRMQRDEIPPFRRILIETTGVADPAPILQSLTGPALRKVPVYLDTVVAVVDSANVGSALEHAQIHRQIAVADHIAITKADRCSAEDLESTRELCRSINPSAGVSEVHMGAISSDKIFGQRLLDPSASTRQRHKSLMNIETKVDSNHHGLQTFVWTHDKPLPRSVLSDFLAALHRYRAGDLLRVKGLVCEVGFEGRPSVIHGVQGEMHSPIRLRSWPSSDHRTRLVFITKELTLRDVASLFQTVAGTFRGS